MRISTCAFLCGAIAAPGAALAVNPPARDANVVLHSTLGEVVGRTPAITGPATDVQPGEVFAITGDCVAGAVSADQLRVVMTFADKAGANTGFRSVIPTDQHIRDRELRVRVPNMPAAENRVLQVRVFSLGQPSPSMCEAGSLRIVGDTPGKVG
jgi:hypothetical protein